MNIIRSTNTRLGDQRQVRRQGTTIGGPCGLRVGIRRRETVRDTARTIKHFTIVIRTIGHLILGSKSLRFFFRISESREMTEADQPHRMAGCADFLVDLISTLQGSLVIGAEQAVERPVHGRRMRGITGCISIPTKADAGDESKCRDKFTHYAFSIGLAAAAAEAPAPPPFNTDAEIDSGRGFGRSNQPTSGRNGMK